MTTSTPVEDALYSVVYQAVRDALKDHGAATQALVATPAPAPRRREAGLRRLAVREAAEVAQCRPETIRRALEAGELLGHQRVKGGRWLIKPEALEAWLGGS